LCKLPISKIENFKNLIFELKNMQELVDESINVLGGANTSIEEFGKLLDISWRFKRSLSSSVTTPEIDRIYEIAMSAGAIGGKLLGAGGGGFMLLFAKPELQDGIRKRLPNLVHVDFKFESMGSRVVLYHPNGL
jgi:D-glycero-alpha-D-manno-heptose-7-phosphate kinase